MPEVDPVTRATGDWSTSSVSLRGSVLGSYHDPVSVTPRARTALPALIALTLGAGVGAAVRDGHQPVTRTSGSAHRATQASHASTEQDRVQQYAREHAFAFLDPPLSSGAVDRWDPCVTIHYRVDIERGLSRRSEALAAIDAAFRQAAAATGMTFNDDGPTSELPSDTRKDIVHTRSGWEWAPVLVAVVPHAAFVRSADSSDTVAYSDPDVYTDDGQTSSQIVTGQIVVDAGRISDQGADDPDGLEPTMLHEIGHLVGLGHVQTKGEIMQPDGGGVVGLGPGDLAGLHYLGSAAGCMVDPALPRDSSDYPK